MFGLRTKMKVGRLGPILLLLGVVVLLLVLVFVVVVVRFVVLVVSFLVLGVFYSPLVLRNFVVGEWGMTYWKERQVEEKKERRRRRRRCDKDKMFLKLNNLKDSLKKNK